eukprot:NODE_98_length_21025_cov_0.475055.p4 type:complete len:572 gc:universal NODE_98_length_21025_cov_0.475055:17290-19005(+)
MVTIMMMTKIGIENKFINFKCFNIFPNMSAPVVVINTGTERTKGRKAQLSCIQASSAVASIVKTCLGPKAMLKMLLDPMGNVVLTNDGNAILRECEVTHPAAKSIIELARTQDDEVGDGTTSVIVLANELLQQAQQHLKFHPIVIINAYRMALEDSLSFLDKIASPLDLNNVDKCHQIIRSTIGTKFGNRYSKLICDVTWSAVNIVKETVYGSTVVDIKRFIRIEKVPGGSLGDSKLLKGVLLNKDVTHPKMRREIKNPRIVLLDCTLEYKKGESQTNIEISKEADWKKYLEIEEEQIKKICDAIIKVNPDVVITEKGVSDLAQHYLLQHNITAIRRVKKSDNLRLQRVCGARIVNRPEELVESDVGLNCKLFKVTQIGEEYFTFIDECINLKACTIMLRGPAKDIINEFERNLQDALCVARNIILDPFLCPGGGATEIALSVELAAKASTVEGTEQYPYASVAEALEVIPKILASNSGAKPIQITSELKSKYTAGEHVGFDGNLNKVVSSEDLGVWEPKGVKVQTLKTAVEATCMLLRVDDIVSGISKKVKGNPSVEENEAAMEAAQNEQ